MYNALSFDTTGVNVGSGGTYVEPNISVAGGGNLSSKDNALDDCKTEGRLFTVNILKSFRSGNYRILHLRHYLVYIKHYALSKDSPEGNTVGIAVYCKGT